MSQVSLSDYAGKYVVLFFYPLDFTFVCPTEIIAFNDRFLVVLKTPALTPSLPSLTPS